MFSWEEMRAHKSCIRQRWWQAALWRMLMPDDPSMGMDVWDIVFAENIRMCAIIHL